MISLYCWMIGGLFAISVYLLLSQQLMRWLFGIVILSSTTNLVIYVCGRHLSAIPPFVSDENTALQLANPLPQALILTAIVIGFGLLAFALVLIRKVWLSFNTLDTDQINTAERKVVSHRHELN